MQDCTCVRERGEALQQVELRGHRGWRHLSRGETPVNLTSRAEWERDRQARGGTLEGERGGASMQAGMADGLLVEHGGKLLEVPSSWRFEGGASLVSGWFQQIEGVRTGWGMGFDWPVRHGAIYTVFSPCPEPRIPVLFSCPALPGLHRRQAQVCPVHAPHRWPLPGVKTPHPMILCWLVTRTGLFSAASGIDRLERYPCFLWRLDADRDAVA